MEDHIEKRSITINPDRYVRLQRRFPTVAYLREGARRRLPRFAFEYLDGGAGADGGIARNRAALDALVLTPRYAVLATLPPIDTVLFGRPYSAPFGVAPMGGPSIVWPGADVTLAAAAQQANFPYVLGTFGESRLRKPPRSHRKCSGFSCIVHRITTTPLDLTSLIGLRPPALTPW